MIAQSHAIDEVTFILRAKPGSGGSPQVGQIRVRAGEPTSEFRTYYGELNLTDDQLRLVQAARKLVHEGGA